MLLVVRSIGSCAKLQAVSESSGSCAHRTCWHKTAYIRLHKSVQECLKSRLLFWQSDGAGTCGMCSAVTCYLVMSGVTAPYVDICCNCGQVQAPIESLPWLTVGSEERFVETAETCWNAEARWVEHVETICRECSLCRLHRLQVRVVILVIWDDTFACGWYVRICPHFFAGLTLSLSSFSTSST